MFDSAGTHLVTWGGEGEGPGEFWWLNHVAAWPGDSIVAWYPSRGRISVFDLGWELRALVRSVGRLSPGVPQGSGGAPGRHHPDHLSG